MTPKTTRAIVNFFAFFSEIIPQMLSRSSWVCCTFEFFGVSLLSSTKVETLKIVTSSTSILLSSWSICSKNSSQEDIPLKPLIRSLSFQMPTLKEAWISSGSLPTGRLFFFFFLLKTGRLLQSLNKAANPIGHQVPTHEAQLLCSHSDSLYFPALVL